MIKSKITKNKCFKNWRLVIGFCLFLGTWNLVIHSAQAQSATGLSAIPHRLEITVNPDEVRSEVIKVRNESNVERTVTTSTSDFIVTDDKGTPIKIDSISEGDNRWAASSWIQVSPSEVKLKPGETKSLVLTIMPPKNALPGGHYAMIIHSPSNNLSPDSTGFSIQAQVGTLLYVTVPGDIKQDAIIQKFNAPGFAEFGPIDFKTTIKNLSDVHINPQGAITVTNMVGGKTAILNLNETNIFPYTIRDFQNTLDRKWLFGRYKAQLNANYGTAGGVVAATLFFWVIPWRLISLIVAAIAIIIAIAFINKQKPQKPQTQVEELEKELEDLKNKYKDRK